jgi:hypothetical protein
MIVEKLLLVYFKFFFFLQNKYLINETEKMKKYLNEQHFQFERLQEDFIKREEQLQQLEEEKVKEMNEILITK